eukprot:PLAT4992.2.p1 GENE.PLAT4992.2~~PLAT4992.2.p1  ORF type:complete len:560 (-),score=212.26 PLAT4992.2:460-2139(-)
MHKAKTLLRRLRSEGSLRDAEARENSPTSLQPDDVGGRDGLEHLRETRKRSFSSARRSSITDLDLAGALPSLVEVVEVHDEVCAADFDAKFVVGKGSFSEVIKVRHRLTNRTWALKVVSKERVLEDRLLAQITREKTLLEELPPHPFVITLQACFHEGRNLYFVLDFAGGGTLLTHLKRRIVLPEEHVRFYIAELVLALEHLHKHHIVHRDIKLDNIQLDSAGHIRLIDFNLAQRVVEGEAVHVCGTPEYLAFEVVEHLIEGGSGFDLYAADWWALGIAMYEMLVGRTPFLSKNKDAENTLKNIYFHSEVPFPDHIHVSDTCLEFMAGLLVKEPKLRLGGDGRGAADLKAHPFLRGIDWDGLRAYTVTPPSKPKEVKPPRLRRCSKSALNVLGGGAGRAAHVADSDVDDIKEDYPEELAKLEAAFTPSYSTEHFWAVVDTKPGVIGRLLDTTKDALKRTASLGRMRVDSIASDSSSGGGGSGIGPLSMFGGSKDRRVSDISSVATHDVGGASSLDVSHRRTPSLEDDKLDGYDSPVVTLGDGDDVDFFVRPRGASLVGS